MRRPPRRLFVLLPLVSLAACVVPDGARPNANLGVDIASAYVFRGMIQNENGVIQPSGVIALPTKKDGTIIARTWANMDMSNDTGDAWLPDGHAGKFSQIDYNLLYEQRLDDATLTAGFINYNLPNGLEFPFGERGATSEFLVEGSYQLPDSWLAIVPALAVHYDFDEVEGFYIRGSLGHEHEFNEKMLLATELGLAWMDGNQAFWHYAEPTDRSGLADLTLRGTFEYGFDNHTTASAFLAYSTIVDSQYREWFDTIGLRPEQFYGGIGIRWSY